MSSTVSWVAAWATMGLMGVYELALAWGHRRHGEPSAALARSGHALLREDWFTAVSAHPGSEILAVQTLRNSLMSATMTASTAALALMGTATLAAPSLHLALDPASSAARITPRFMLELLLMAQLFASLVLSVMAVRYYNHAGFVSAMPVGSDARRRWNDAGRVYVRRAGILYSWGLRHLILITPVLAGIVHPLAGPVTAVVVVLVLAGFDRFGSAERLTATRAAPPGLSEPPAP